MIKHRFIISLLYFFTVSLSDLYGDGGMTDKHHQQPYLFISGFRKGVGIRRRYYPLLPFPLMWFDLGQ